MKTGVDLQYWEENEKREGDVKMRRMQMKMSEEKEETGGRLSDKDESQRFRQKGLKPDYLSPCLTFVSDCVISPNPFLSNLFTPPQPLITFLLTSFASPLNLRLLSIQTKHVWLNWNFFASEKQHASCDF